jgi:beta-lactamase class A
MKTVAIACLTLALSAWLQAQETRPDLARQIRAVAAEYGVRVGVAAKHLGTGQTVGVDGDSLFPTASVIKLPVLVALFHQFAAGRLAPMDPVELRAADARPGSGILQFLHGGTTLPLIDVATLMIILSDNTATNYVIDRLGAEHEERLEAVNSRMRELGLRRTKLLNKLYSWETKKKTEEARRFGIGVTSPADMALLLEEIGTGAVDGPAASDSIVAILRRQQDVQLAARSLPFAADSTLWIGNKTGSLDEVKNDVGLVAGSGGKYVYAIFCDGSKSPGEETDNPATLAVAKISRLLYDAFLGSQEKGRR